MTYFKYFSILLATQIEFFTEQSDALFIYMIDTMMNVCMSIEIECKSRQNDTPNMEFDFVSPSWNHMITAKKGWIRSIAQMIEKKSKVTPDLSQQGFQLAMITIESLPNFEWLQIYV